MKTSMIVAIILICAAVLGAGCTQQAPQQTQPQVTVTPPVLQDTPAQPAATTTPTPISQASVSANTIIIRNFAFEPQTIRVKAGSIVRWENRDTVTHRIMFSDKNVAGSDPLSYSQSSSKKFDRSGTFTYYCSIHPEMTGTVIVE
jgi:plastocyanin